MSITFTKLFSSITESTIWCEDAPTRIVWITMLAMADRQGRIWASIPGLANRARVTIEQCENALQKFQEPDTYSRTPDNEGRRITAIDGGWFLLNHKKYRELRDEEDRREYKREWIKDKRRQCRQNVDNVDRGRPQYTNADADADADKIQNISVESEPSTVAKKSDSIQKIFDHWRSSYNHPQARLDPKRRRLIERALNGYSETDLCQAITGYKNSSHHMGQNDRHTIYDDISLFLRDAQHIEDGIRFAAAKPTRTAAELRLVIA